MKLVLFFLFSISATLTAQARTLGLTEVQDYIYRVSYNLAVNQEVNRERQYLVTHKELNEVVELVRRYQLKTKDVFAIYQETMKLAAQDGGSDRENIARDDLRRAWGMIFSVRTTMDTHEMNPNWLCLFKPIASPMDAVAPDSIQNNPDKFPLSKEEIERLTVRDNDRVIMAVCGPRKKAPETVSFQDAKSGQSDAVDSVLFNRTSRVQ